MTSDLYKLLLIMTKEGKRKPGKVTILKAAIARLLKQFGFTLIGGGEKTTIKENGKEVSTWTKLQFQNE